MNDEPKKELTDSWEGIRSRSQAHGVMMANLCKDRYGELILKYVEEFIVQEGPASHEELERVRQRAENLTALVNNVTHADSMATLGPHAIEEFWIVTQEYYGAATLDDDILGTTDEFKAKIQAI